MKNLKIIALATVFIFAGMLTTKAQDADQPKPAKREFHKHNDEKMKALKEELKLSDEQVEKIKAIHEKNEAEKAAHKDKLKEINQAEKEEIKQVLTEEQKAILRAKIEEKQTHNKKGEMRQHTIKAQPVEKVQPVEKIQPQN